MSGRRAWAYWAFITLLVIANFTLHLGLGLGPEAPDLLVVAVLLGARQLTGIGAAALGFGLGLLRDSLSLSAFGADVVAMTVIGFLGARSRDLFIGDSLVFVALFIFVGKWLHDAIYFLLARAAVGGDAVTRLLIEAPIAALYAAASGVVALLLYRLITGDR